MIPSTCQARTAHHQVRCFRYQLLHVQDALGSSDLYYKALMNKNKHFVVRLRRVITGCRTVLQHWAVGSRC